MKDLFAGIGVKLLRVVLTQMPQNRTFRLEKDQIQWK
jgi:hypothetical protein